MLLLKLYIFPLDSIVFFLLKFNFSPSKLTQPILRIGFPTTNSKSFISLLTTEPAPTKENLPTLFGSEDLQVTRWGTLKTDFDTMETNLPGVFAAGDIIRGASLVVWAIKDGRDAALSIKKFLENKKIEKQKVA